MELSDGAGLGIQLLGAFGVRVSGSVSPKHPSHSPEHSFGRYFFFCSSLPQRRIDEHTSEVCTEMTVRIAESWRPISSTTTAYVR